MAARMICKPEVLDRLGVPAETGIVTARTHRIIAAGLSRLTNPKVQGIRRKG
jgi:hypothetical protein